MNDSLMRSINDLQARITNIESEIKALNARIDNQCQAALHEKIQRDLQSETVHSFEDEIEEQKKNFEEYKVDASNRFTLLENHIQRNTQTLQAYGKFFEKIDALLKEIQERLHIYYETCNANLSSANEIIRQEIKEAINAIPKPQIPSFSEISDLILHKIEPISLDAKNGQLRSSHCEMKITIMEKKIEQLFLLMQKHSISP